MNKILKKLNDLTAILEERILDRTTVFENLSEKWQESEKGEEYEEQTDRLQEMLDEATDWTEELEN